MASTSSSLVHVIKPGPEDPSLLYLQDKHVSQHVWNDSPDRILRWQRVQQFHAGGADIPPALVENLKLSGFYGVAQMMFLPVDHKLISALVERWRPETHTFHMPFGECTITLQDVAILLGIAVEGKAVVSHICTDWASLVDQLLGIRPPHDALSGNGLKMSWLETNFGIFPKVYDQNEEVKLIYTRAFILRLIGGIMFTNHSGTYVPLEFLYLLQDLNETKKYSWGSAMLSYFYHELCLSTNYLRRDICGFLPLIQLWAWERFPSIAPEIRRENEPNHDYETTYGTRWVHGRNYTTPSHSLKWYRMKFDQLKQSDIAWEPYSAYILGRLPPIALEDMSSWRSVCPLIYYNIVEWHQPDRVMRQFGMRQHIPIAPSQPPKLHDLTLRGKQNLNWEHRLHNIIDKWNKRGENIVWNEQQILPLDKQSEYMRWYLRHTRRWMTWFGANQGYLVDSLERINFICSREGHRKNLSDDDIKAIFAEIKLLTDNMLASMNEINRIHLSSI